MATWEQIRARVIGEWKEEEDMSAQTTFTTSTASSSNPRYAPTINGATYAVGGHITLDPEAVAKMASSLGGYSIYKKEETMATVNLDDLFEVFPEIKPKFKKGQKAEAYAQFVADVTNVAKQHRDNKAYDRISKIKGSK